jgi:hypothetical protein
LPISAGLVRAVVDAEVEGLAVVRGCGAGVGRERVGASRFVFVLSEGVRSGGSPSPEGRADDPMAVEGAVKGLGTMSGLSVGEAGRAGAIALGMAVRGRVAAVWAPAVEPARTTAKPRQRDQKEGFAMGALSARLISAVAPIDR